MIPFNHPSNNRILQAPEQWDHQAVPCDALNVTVYSEDGLHKVASFWTPTPKQLAVLNNGGTIALIVIGGMPPVILGVSEPVEEYLGDTTLEAQDEAG